MPTCPQCHQSVVASAVTCPSCGLELKAHGHPGIDLHRAQAGAYLCESCAYQKDNSCTFPQRPQAITCTLYQNLVQEPRLKASDIYRIPWWRKHSGWIALAIMALVSFTLIVL